MPGNPRTAGAHQLGQPAALHQPSARRKGHEYNSPDWPAILLDPQLTLLSSFLNFKPHLWEVVTPNSKQRTAKDCKGHPSEHQSLLGDDPIFLRRFFLPSPGQATEAGKSSKPISSDPVAWPFCWQEWWPLAVWKVFFLGIPILLRHFESNHREDEVLLLSFSSAFLRLGLNLIWSLNVSGGVFGSFWGLSNSPKSEAQTLESSVTEAKPPVTEVPLPFAAWPPGFAAERRLAGRATALRRCGAGAVLEGQGAGESDVGSGSKNFGFAFGLLGFLLIFWGYSKMHLFCSLEFRLGCIFTSVRGSHVAVGQKRACWR